mmetsp:Transcript_32832/g.50157  ORF Transcript_32832/g.50157 Transcript_32832/m.50157 type:complete len:199 (+) Transcript_32832:1124-1720(+)
MSNLWAVVFFMMLLLIGIDSIFGMMDYTIAFIIDTFPILLKHFQKQYIVLVLTVFFMIFSSLFATNNGWWYFNIFNDHVGGWGILFVLLSEIYSFTFVFGFEKLDALIYFRTGEVIPQWMKMCLKYLTLPLSTVIMASSIFQELKPVYDNPWANLLGKSLTLMPVAAVLIGMCRKQKCPSIDALVKHQCGHSLEELVQ